MPQWLEPIEQIPCLKAFKKGVSGPLSLWERVRVRVYVAMHVW